MEPQQGSAFWDGFAADWRVDPPQAPDASDLAWFLAEAGRSAEPRGPLLVLGATPEFGRVPWPEGFYPVATDGSLGMLRKVWSAGPGAGRNLALQGDWLRLPWRDRSAALAVGDGCFGVLPDLDSVAAACREVGRVLQPGGRLLVRCMVRTPGMPAVDELFERLLGGEVERIGWWRWQVAMALQEAGERRVDRHRLWQLWTSRLPGWADLPALGYLPQDRVHRIARWEGEATPLHFPRLEELVAAATEGLGLAGTAFPEGPGAAHLPRLVLERSA